MIQWPLIARRQNLHSIDWHYKTLYAIIAWYYISSLILSYIIICAPSAPTNLCYFPCLKSPHFISYPTPLSSTHCYPSNSSLLRLFTFIFKQVGGSFLSPQLILIIFLVQPFLTCCQHVSSLLNCEPFKEGECIATLSTFPLLIIEPDREKVVNTEPFV